MADRDLRSLLLARPDRYGSVDLASIDTSGTPRALSHRAVEHDLRGPLGQQLADLNDLVYADKGTKVLLVLQGLDASGKNGTIKHVMSHLNPASVRVASFKEPTREEQRHHFLWRIRQQLPEGGELVVFDRSHYEDLIVPLATGTIDRRLLEKRSREVNLFEQELAEDSTMVIKCMLHISYEEQRARFLRRLRRTDKRWKFNESDLDTRDRWDDFQPAYGSVLGCTSTAHAPWYVIPSDHKWYRNWAVATIITESLTQLGLRYPQPDLDIAAMRRRLKAS